MGVVPAGIVQDYSHRGYRIGEYVLLAFKIDNSDKVTTLDKTFLNDNTVSSVEELKRHNIRKPA